LQHTCTLYQSEVAYEFLSYLNTSKFLEPPDQLMVVTMVSGVLFTTVTLQANEDAPVPKNHKAAQSIAETIFFFMGSPFIPLN